MSTITLRFVTADDVGLLLQLIRELAAYERAPDAVMATEDDLRRHGFGPAPRFKALLALVDGEPAGSPCFFRIFRPGAAGRGSFSRTSMSGNGRAGSAS